MRRPGGPPVRLSPSQYRTYETAEDLAATLGLRRRPEIYLANGNGALNAFAAQATGYDYVVLSNELFVNLHNNNSAGLRFILGHEMGHIRLHHVSLWYQIAVAYSERIPLLGPALSRLREYSCDRHGACLLPRRHDRARPARLGPVHRATSTSTSCWNRAGCCGVSGSAWPSCRCRTRCTAVPTCRPTSGVRPTRRLAHMARDRSRRQRADDRDLECDDRRIDHRAPARRRSPAPVVGAEFTGTGAPLEGSSSRTRSRESAAATSSRLLWSVRVSRR